MSQKKKIYLASRFSLQGFLKEMRTEIEARGYEVTSTWLDATRPMGGVDLDPFFAKWCVIDMDDIEQPSALVLIFTKKLAHLASVVFNLSNNLLLTCIFPSSFSPPARVAGPCSTPSSSDFDEFGFR